VARHSGAPQALAPDLVQQPAIREIRRRTDVVGTLPGPRLLTRLVDAVLAEQHDEWTEGRRHLGLAPHRVAAAVLLASAGPGCVNGWDRLLAAPGAGPVCALAA
jgi:hypothetical protein